MDPVEADDERPARESDALVLDVLCLAGILVLAGLTALTARAAAKR